jgi:hypothetical protein
LSHFFITFFGQKNLTFIFLGFFNIFPPPPPPPPALLVP